MAGCQSLKNTCMRILNNVSLRPLAVGNMVHMLHMHWYVQMQLAFSCFSAKPLVQSHLHFHLHQWMGPCSLACWLHASLPGANKEFCSLPSPASRRPWLSALHSKIGKLILVPNSLCHKPRTPASYAWWKPPIVRHQYCHLSWGRSQHALRTPQRSGKITATKTWRSHFWGTVWSNFYPKTHTWELVHNTMLVFINFQFIEPLAIQDLL